MMNKLASRDGACLFAVSLVSILAFEYAVLWLDRAC
jgi:hypothetical protein